MRLIRILALANGVAAAALLITLAALKEVNAPVVPSAAILQAYKTDPRLQADPEFGLDLLDGVQYWHSRAQWYRFFCALSVALLALNTLVLAARRPSPPTQ